MSVSLRVLLFVCSLLVLAFVVRKIRKMKFSMADALFWLLVSAGLLVVAIFPEIAFFFSALLGFESPANFVFLVVIALLLVHMFNMQQEMSSLNRRLTSLAQEIAIHDKENR